MGSMVYMTGSRMLADEYGPLMDRVMSVLAGTGSSVAVTCAAGAEVMALIRAAGLGRLAAVFAVGDAGGAGFWAGSCPFTLLQCWGGQHVRWLAGGSVGTPLPVRLWERTRACFRFVASSGPGGRVIAFSSTADCPETLAACERAQAFGLPMIVFPCGFAASELQPLAPGGQWAQAGPGVWADALRWGTPKVK